MQQLHHLGHDWSDNGCMILHQGTDILISTIDGVTNLNKTISNLQIPAHCIATIPTKLTGKCITATLCIMEVNTNEIISICNLEVFMLPMVYLKDEMEPAQVLLTYKIHHMMQTK